MDTAMRNECALSPIHLRRWIGSGLKLDYIITHDLREVCHHYTYHEIFGLLIGLACHGLWRMLYRYLLFCSYSNIREERGLFSDG